MAHYVNNKKLYETLVEYKDKIKVCESEGKQLPRIPEYVGECIWQIANRLSTKPNFVNYTYRDEMISDGIENCVNYLGNFNPEKSTNPFAYFTQIIYYAFLRRIQREKKQLYIKHKQLENAVVHDEMATQGVNQDGGDHSSYVNLNTDYMNDFVASFEAKEAEKKAARVKKKGLENFVEEENTEG